MASGHRSRKHPERTELKPDPTPADADRGRAEEPVNAFQRGGGPFVAKLVLYVRSLPGDWITTAVSEGSIKARTGSRLLYQILPACRQCARYMQPHLTEYRAGLCNQGARRKSLRHRSARAREPQVLRRDNLLGPKLQSRCRNLLPVDPYRFVRGLEYRPSWLHGRNGGRDTFWRSPA